MFQTRNSQFLLRCRFCDTPLEGADKLARVTRPHIEINGAIKGRVWYPALNRMVSYYVSTPTDKLIVLCGATCLEGFRAEREREFMRRMETADFNIEKNWHRLTA